MQFLADLHAGQTFARDFKVVRPLAEGGMGAVFVVEQVSTGKERALKIMHPRLVQDPRNRERFVQEARIGGRIESDHVVEVVAAGVDDESGAPWLAMEMLRGETLGELMTRRKVLEPFVVREVYTQLGHALSAAHRAGIVHRDIKPENVFLAAPRRAGVAFTVKVLDFGISKFVGGSMAVASTTAAVGSPLWMAPEQTGSAHVTPATDVWPLGLMAFYMLTGRAYWRTANAEGLVLAALFSEICVEPIEPARARAALWKCEAAVPDGFDAWFSRCVVRDVALRFAEAGEAVEALSAVLAPVSTQVAWTPSLRPAVSYPSHAGTAPKTPDPREADIGVADTYATPSSMRPPASGPPPTRVHTPDPSVRLAPTPLPFTPPTPPSTPGFPLIAPARGPIVHADGPSPWPRRARWVLAVAVTVLIAKHCTPQIGFDGGPRRHRNEVLPIRPQPVRLAEQARRNHAETP